jgi:hypothetical protein
MKREKRETAGVRERDREKERQERLRHPSRDGTTRIVSPVCLGAGQRGSSLRGFSVINGLFLWGRELVSSGTPPRHRPTQWCHQFVAITMSIMNNERTRDDVRGGGGREKASGGWGGI